MFGDEALLASAARRLSGLVLDNADDLSNAADDRRRSYQPYRPVM